MVMGVSKSRASKMVQAAAKSSLLGGHSADEIDNINTLGGVVSALVLAFVLGLQYMVAPGTEDMKYADYRSLLCKSQEFRIFVRDVLKTEDIGTYSEEYFNFTKMVRPGQYMDIEQFLVSGIMSKWGETDSGADHIPCIGDKDIQTAVALTIEDFPTKYLRAWVLQAGDPYRWSEVTERMGSVSAALIFSALLWSIILNLSLALAPVREDSSGAALVAWLMIGGPMMLINYIFMVVGLILFFVTHGRQLMAMSPFAGATESNTVTMSLFGLMLPVFVLGLLLGTISKVWADYTARKVPKMEAAESERVGDDAPAAGKEGEAVTAVAA